MNTTTETQITTAESIWYRWWIRFVIVPLIVVVIGGFIGYRLAFFSNLAKVSGDTTAYDVGAWGVLHYNDRVLTQLRSWTLNDELSIGVSDESYHYRRGRAMHQVGDMDSALSEYKQAPNILGARYSMGRVLMSLEKPNYESAAAIFEEVLSDSADHLGATYYLGVCNMWLLKHEIAVKYFKDVLAKNPQCLGAHHNLGVCYLLYLDDHEQAAPYFDYVCDANPVFPRAIFWKGVAAFKGGDKPLALQSIKLAYGLDPTWVCSKLESGELLTLRADSVMRREVERLLVGEYGP